MFSLNHLSWYGWKLVMTYSSFPISPPSSLMSLLQTSILLWIAERKTSLAFPDSHPVSSFCLAAGSYPFIYALMCSSGIYSWLSLFQNLGGSLTVSGLSTEWLPTFRTVTVTFYTNIKMLWHLSKIVSELLWYQTSGRTLCCSLSFPIAGLTRD